MFLKYEPSKSSRNKQNCSAITLGTKACAIVVLGVLVSSCSVTSQTASLTDEDLLVTGSVAKPNKPEGVDGTDAELIKTVVVDSGPIKPQSSELAWNNPDTGNSGTIVAIDKFVGSHGQSCKKFQTTIDSFMGISLYDGETCEVKRGLWVLSWFTRR